MKKVFNDIKQALLTGVSYMLPVVVAGGVLLAMSFVFGGIGVGSAEGGFWKAVNTWGMYGMTMMVPILGAYVAFSLGDKPAIVAGLFGGLIAADQGSGFLGALIAGIAAGYIVRALKQIKLPPSLRSLLPILIIPVLSCFAIGIFMNYIVGYPVTWLNQGFMTFLNNMSGGSVIILGLIQGAMLAFDLGGPLNKAAYAFAIAAMEAGNFAPMAANFVGAMSPPLAMALVLTIKKSHFTREERLNAPACLLGGLCQISEFAIPFAAKKPHIYIPSFMVGAGVGCALSYILGVTMQSPHGGMFVLGLSNNIPAFLLCLAVAAVVAAGMIILLTKPLPQEEQGLEEAAEETI